MGLYDIYDQPDPDDERRKLEEMHMFVHGAPMPEEQQQDEPSQQQLFDQDRAAPPDPNVERAAPIVEGRSGGSGYPDPRELEDDAMRAVRDSYGKKHSFFEDSAPAAIALGLDAIFNRSRGAGAIAGGFAQGKARQEQDDKSSMRQMAELEITRARESANDKYRQQQNDVNTGNLKARNDEIEIARARQRAEAGDPEAKRRLLESQTNENEATAYQKWTGADKEITPYQQAMLDAAKDEHASRDKDRDADREYRIQSHDDAEKARAAQAAIAAATRDSTNERLQTTADTNATNTFLGKTEKERSQLQLLNSARPIIDDPKYKNDLPGVGKLDSNLPSWVMHPFNTQARADADSMKQTLGEAEKYFQNKVTGVAGSKAEFDDIAALKGLGGTEAQQRLALKRWRESIESDIRGAASASPNNARHALESQGLDSVLPPLAAGPRPLGTPTQSIQPGAARGGNNFDVSGPASPPAGDVLQTQPGTPPKVSDYLRKMQDEDDDLGVSYR